MGDTALIIPGVNIMRKSGVLMHISSLPGNTGIGTMGGCAREFVDFLYEAGQSYWQVLPVCPTSYGDSPYQSFSCEAGNPYFIDLDELAAEGLLEKSEYESIDWESEPDSVNYGVMYEKRYKVLELAAARFLLNPDPDYESFLKENAGWLDDYAAFMALKHIYDGESWDRWEKNLRAREEKAMSAFLEENADGITFWKVIQFLFFKQWKALKKYANARQVSIIGDLPIYVSYDSADVWAHPELFQLDENELPIEVAGCPPDGFSADGQLWGNPLYDWEHMAEDDYSWWIERIRYQCSIYDMLRIDHFRGFESYYAIPYGDTTARCGRWRRGPGISLFQKAEKVLGRQNIIAENLGFLTDAVHQMLDESGYPGMNVLEFAFDPRDDGGNLYLPHNYKDNVIAYVGTHDNDTAVGWYQDISDRDRAYAKTYMGLSEEEGISWGMMRNIWCSKAMITVVQAQDLLELGSEARMNTPSTLGENWKWRALPGSFSRELAEKLRYRTGICGRR